LEEFRMQWPTIELKNQFRDFWSGCKHRHHSLFIFIRGRPREIFFHRQKSSRCRSLHAKDFVISLRVMSSPIALYAR
jgi:hypothetical protein